MNFVPIERHNINIACCFVLLWLLDKFLCGYRIQKVPKFSITLKHVWKITEKLSTKNHDCEKVHLAKKIMKPEKDSLKYEYYVKNKGKSQFKKRIYHNLSLFRFKKIQCAKLRIDGKLSQAFIFLLLTYLKKSSEN